MPSSSSSVGVQSQSEIASAAGVQPAQTLDTRAVLQPAIVARTLTASTTRTSTPTSDVESEPDEKKKRLLSESNALTGQQEADLSVRLVTTRLENPSAIATEASLSTSAGTAAMSARDPVKDLIQ